MRVRIFTSLPKHYPEIICQDGLGFVQTRWELGDTSGRTRGLGRAGNRWNAAPDEFLSEDFPFCKVPIRALPK